MKKNMKHARKKIQAAVIELLQEENFEQLKVTQICRKADVNRATFYKNYDDIFDMREQLRDYVAQTYQNDLNKDKLTSLLSLLKEIKQNQKVYRLFFHLSLDKNLNQKYEFAKWLIYPQNSSEYDHIFVQEGIRAILLAWLKNHCEEDVTEINQIIVHNLKNLGLKINTNQQ